MKAVVQVHRVEKGKVRGEGGSETNKQTTILIAQGNDNSDSNNQQCKEIDS